MSSPFHHGNHAPSEHDALNEGDDSEEEMDVVHAITVPTFGRRIMRKVKVSRSAMTQDELDESYGKTVYPKRKIRETLREVTSCSRDKCAAFTVILFPIIYFCKTYNFREFLFGDALGGLSVACLHFPQGLAYGILANLTPSHGLYSSFFPVVLYMIFGTSPHVSMGTNAIVSIMIQEMLVMEPIKTNIPVAPSWLNTTADNASLTAATYQAAALEYKERVTAGSTLLVGIIMVLMSVLRLGFVTSYLSRSFISGFTTGAGVHIFTSQIGKALGIKIPVYTGFAKIIYTYVDIFKNITDSNVASAVITVVCLVILFVVKDCINERFKDKMKMPVPIDLIIIIVATVISHFAKFEENFDVKIIGDVPRGIPAPTVPLLEPFGTIFIESFKIAILTCFLNLSMAKLCARLNGYEIEENAELMAYGMSNLGSAFFRCIPASVAPPRTMLLSILGAKTTLNAIFTAIVLILFLYAIGPLFASLPLPVLAAMIMVAMKSLLMQVREAYRYWRVSPYDTVIWIVSFLSAVVMDLPYGLICGILVSLFTVVAQSQKSKILTLGKTSSDDLYLSMEEHDCTKEKNGIKIIRIESSLYFATAEKFRKQVYRVIWHPDRLNRDIRINSLNYIRRVSTQDFRRMSRVPSGIELVIFPKDKNQSGAPKGEFFKIEPSSKAPDVYDHVGFLIVDCLPITYIDMNGLDILTAIAKDLQRVDITLFLARCSSYMLKVLEKSDIYNSLPSKNVFADLEDAVVEAEARLYEMSKTKEREVSGTKHQTL